MPKRKVNVEKQILDALRKEGKLTWTDLLKQTNVSKGSLSKHLNMPHMKDIVERTVDSTTKPPKVYYTLKQNKQHTCLVYCPFCGNKFDLSYSRDHELLNLLKSGSLRWSDLLNATTYSKRTLSLHLKKMIQLGKIERYISDDGYPPPVFYKLKSIEGNNE